MVISLRVLCDITGIFDRQFSISWSFAVWLDEEQDRQAAIADE